MLRRNVEVANHPCIDNIDGDDALPVLVEHHFGALVAA